MRTITTGPRSAGGALLLLLVGSALPAAAAPAGDWPCVQRLVPTLEAGQMWSGPPLDAAAGKPVPAEVDRLAGELIGIDLPAEALDAKVKAFAEQAPSEQRTARLALLFATALDRLNAQRAELINGIKRYAKRQHALADKITAETRELDAARREAGGDPARLQELQASHDWDTRVFTDRQRQLRLVCDQPVRLEQRAFALARTIQGHLP
jgi:hypothetical protein